MSRFAIDVPGGAKAGPYSDAVQAGPLVYVSGKVGLDPVTSTLVEGGVGPQTRQAISNAGRVLAEAGLTLDDVVKCNVYLTGMEDFTAMNEVYGGCFASPAPARTTVAVAGLPLMAAVEIEMIAVRRSIKDEAALD